MTVLLQSLAAVAILAALGFAVTAPVAATLWVIDLMARNGLLAKPSVNTRSNRKD